MPVPLDNVPQIVLAILVLALAGAPPGWLFLRVLRLGARWGMLPVAVVTGHLLLALVYSLVAASLDAPLGMVARGGLWLALTGTLGLFYVAVRRVPIDSPPAFTRRSQGIALMLVAGIAALIAVVPLMNHNADTALGRETLALYDWPKHVAMGTALRTDDHLPPANPFLSVEPALRYYYFGFVAPGMVPALTGGAVSVANSLIALSGLAAFAFPVLVYQLARGVGLAPGGALVAAAGVTLVGGLDVLYNYGLYREWGYWPTHVDGWMPFSLRRVSAPGTLFIWTFQHVLGLELAMLVAWLFVLDDRDVFRVLGAGALLAALFGTSTIVWLPVVAGLGLFTLGEVLRAAWRGTIAAYRAALLVVASLGLGLLLSLPYFGSLVGGNPNATPVLSISSEVPTTAYASLFGAYFGPGTLASALDFPLQMIPEFGVLLVTGLLGLWAACRAWRTRAVRLGAILLGVAFVMMLVVREDLPQTNSYAPRIAGIAWIVLGLFTGSWWTQRRRSRWWRFRSARAALAVLVGLGIASTLYEPVVIVAHPQAISPQDAGLYDWLNAHLDRDAVYLIDRQTPAGALLFVERRTALAADDFADLFSAGPLQTQQAHRIIDAAFEAADPREAALLFRSIGLDCLVLSDGDPASFARPERSHYFTLLADLPGYRVFRVDGP